MNEKSTTLTEARPEGNGVEVGYGTSVWRTMIDVIGWGVCVGCEVAEVGGADAVGATTPVGVTTVLAAGAEV